MKIVKALDAYGNEYLAYEGYTKKGTVVHIDKQLADMCDDPEALLEAEIRAYEESELSVH